MKTLTFALALLLAAPAVVAAAEKPPATKKASRGRGRPQPAPVRPVNITASTFEIQPDRERAVWKGNVVVERDDMKITCDTLTAEYREGARLERLTCDGNAYLLQKADPPRHEEREAWGERAVFENEQGLLTVSGSPRAREGTTRMRGKTVLFYVDENRLKVEQPVFELETAPDGGGPRLPGKGRQ
jgi:lipopolysaccharide export system protein LptA